MSIFISDKHTAKLYVHEILVQEWIDLHQKILKPFNKPTGRA